MKLKVFNSLFDEKVFLKLPIKLWKYLGILWFILFIVFQKFLYTIFPMIFVYIFLKIFLYKDLKLVELLIDHYMEKNKYYNP